MKKLAIVFTVFCVINLSSSCDYSLKKNIDFGAYYTKIESGEKFEQFSRTGDYPDIIVDLGSEIGQLIFWRGSNFLPYWKPANGNEEYLPEIIKRTGDGNFELMPDRVNTYSHAKIIESSEDEVLIHWRYLRSFSDGNPHKGVGPEGFVDEYFTINPTGEVHRTIREGKKQSDEWNDMGNIVCQTIILEKNGIKSSDLNKDYASQVPARIDGVAKFNSVSDQSIVQFNFDEGYGNESLEKNTDQAIKVSGRKVLWRKGVSGTCLQFDGYNTEVRIPMDSSLPVKDEISLQAFIAIGAYPWSWCPVVQQCDDVPEVVSKSRKGGDFKVMAEKENDRGFFLGINGYGSPGFKIRIGDEWIELDGDFHLERRQWYMITGTYSSKAGELKIFVNEQLVGSKKVSGNIELSDNDILIGRGKIRRPINPVRENTFPGQYAFDGLIDEVRILDVALSSEQIGRRSKEAKNIMAEPVDMDERILPTGDKPQEFGAYYDHLSFYDVWDNLWCFGDHPDIVVGFDDNPSKFIFWRGVSYIPMMVNERGQWYSNEFNETWGTSGGDGCQEPMSDKGNYFTHARILENTPARVVVHYRFPLADVNLVKANLVEETGWYDVADWYYYIYPDGIAVKRKHLWTSGNRNHEWQESMAIFGPDQHPEDIIEKNNTVRMQNMEGESATYNWITAPPPNVNDPEGQCIQTVNYTGRYDPVTIGEAFEGSNVYGGELTPYSVFPTWNHWPVAQMPSDGRYASYPDRTGHSSLTHVYLPVYAESDGDKPFYEKLLMEGMLDTEKVDLVALARSWNRAPSINTEENGSGYYDKAQRAYVIENAIAPIELSLMANTEQPLYGTCLVLKNWSKSEASVLIDGEPGEFRQGITRDGDGNYQLIVWLDIKAAKTVVIRIQQAVNL